MTNSRTHRRTHLFLLIGSALFTSALAGCVSDPPVLAGPYSPPKLRDFASSRGAPCDEPKCDDYREYLSTYESESHFVTCSDDETDSLTRKMGAAPTCAPQFVTVESDYFNPEKLEQRFADERGWRKRPAAERECPAGQECARLDDRRPYRIGLALGGGGTKAADYSLGVLSGLLDRSRKDALPIDAVSSVSGGSYAALWYFSRLIDEYQISGEQQGRNRFTRRIFTHCLPRRYSGLMVDRVARTPQLCPKNDASYPSGQSRSGSLRDDLRFQNHLRGFQNFLSKDFDGRDSASFGSRMRSVGGLTWQLGKTMASLPVYFITNFVFDWEDLEISPTANAYFAGIERTYGLRPFRCRALPGLTTPESRDGLACREGGRPSPNANTARGHTMSALSNLYYQQSHYADSADGERDPDRPPPRPDVPRIPFWIANTTAQVSRVPLSFTQRGDYEDTVFEFTPYSFGSRHFGRWIGTPADLDISRVVGASGAFLDSQQRVLAAPVNFLAATGLSAMNMNWGIDINNPRYRNEVRDLHRALPFPLYLLHRNGATRRSAWIHLSDGGQSDNTGIWSLVRRGVTTILFADNGHDADGRFGDLCRLRKNLEPRGLALYIPELEGFDRTCGDTRKKDRKKHKLTKWRHRIVTGCITSSREPGCSPREKPEYFAKLILLKPALSIPTLEPYLDDCDRDDLTRNDDTRCADALARLQAEVAGYEHFPAELFGFLVNNKSASKKPRTPFPQNSTVSMTINSGPYLFGAYRELGRWQAQAISKEMLEN